MGDNDFRNKVAIVGAGVTKVQRRADVPAASLAVEASDAAIADAGLTRKDIDGVACGVSLPSYGMKDRPKQAGFDFVDVKHCHGYFLHELLSATDRPGPYGGDLAGRTHFLRTVVAGIRSQAPGLAVGVRLSAFDLIPYRPGEGGICEPDGTPIPRLLGHVRDAARAVSRDLGASRW